MANAVVYASTTKHHSFETVGSNTHAHTHTPSLSESPFFCHRYAKSLSSSFARKVISSGGGLHLVAAFADEGVTPLHSGLFIQPGGMIWRSKFLSDEMRARAAAFDYSPPNLTEERVDWIDPVLFMWLVTGVCVCECVCAISPR